MICEPLRHTGSVRYAKFSGKDTLVATAPYGEAGAAYLWNVPRARKRAPDWLADWAELVGGLSLTSELGTRAVPFSRLEEIKERVRREAEKDTDDPFAQSAVWSFDVPRTRALSPFSSRGVSDYVDGCVENATTLAKATGRAGHRGVIESLMEAVRFAPDRFTPNVRTARVLSESLIESPVLDLRRRAEAKFFALQALAVNQRSA